MAVYSATSLSNKTAHHNSFGNTVTEVGIVTVTSNLLLADTIDLVRVAGGTYLFSLETFNGDLDTGTASLVFKLGYRKANSAGVLTDDDDYFGSSLTTWQAPVLGSARTRWAFTPINFNEDVIIYATVTTAGNALSASANVTCFAQGVMRGIK